MDAGAWDALRSIAADPSIKAQRPNVGCKVRVIQGRLLGVEGVVQWHGQTQYTRRAYRYCDSMMSHMLDIRGLWGWRVKVQPDDGSPFFIDAEKVCVL